MSPRKWAAFSNWRMIIRVIATGIITTMIRRIAREPVAPEESHLLASAQLIARSARCAGNVGYFCADVEERRMH